MSSLTLQEAARESGRSARELRLTIEAGDLPAVQQGGRWMVDAVALERLALSGRDPGPRHLSEVPPPDDLERHPLDELLARLEARALEVAALRRDLAAARAELERERTRVAEPEGGERAGAARRPGMRDALSPLFEQTREPDS